MIRIPTPEKIRTGLGREFVFLGHTIDLPWYDERELYLYEDTTQVGDVKLPTLVLDAKNPLGVLVDHLRWHVLRLEERVIVRHDTNDREAVCHFQNTRWGPSLLGINRINGFVKWGSMIMRTLTLPNSYYTREGLWKSSEHEYLARELKCP